MINEDNKEKMTPSPLVGEGRGEGLKHQTLSRICKLAFGSLTNSTPVLKLLHAHRVSPKLLRNRRLNLFAIRINSLSLNHPSAISLSQRERVCRKAAFTLAEVLITLGIIGVVAAMTMPALIANYEKKQAATRLKQTYSQLQQAIAFSVLENGEIRDWNWPQENWFDTYIAKYLKLSREKTTFKLLDNENPDQVDYIPYKQISGEQERGLAILREGFSGSKSYILLNGVELIVTKDSDTRVGEILVDINSSAKRPNQFGKDAFFLVMYKDYGLQFFGMKPDGECTYIGNRDRNYFMSSDSCEFQYQCNREGRGMWCGALIMIDGWEIKKDYPW